MMAMMMTAMKVMFTKSSSMAEVRRLMKAEAAEGDAQIMKITIMMMMMVMMTKKKMMRRVLMGMMMLMEMMRNMSWSRLLLSESYPNC